MDGLEACEYATTTVVEFATWARALRSRSAGHEGVTVNELIRRWVLSGPQNRLLRLSRIDQREFPLIVRTWANGIHSFQLDAVDGRIHQTIQRLMLATPELLRDKRLIEEEPV